MGWYNNIPEYKHVKVGVGIEVEEEGKNVSLEQKRTLPDNVESTDYFMQGAYRDSEGSLLTHWQPSVNLAKLLKKSEADQDSVIWAAGVNELEIILQSLSPCPENTHKIKRLPRPNYSQWKSDERVIKELPCLDDFEVYSQPIMNEGCTIVQITNAAIETKGGVLLPKKEFYDHASKSDSDKKGMRTKDSQKSSSFWRKQGFTVQSRNSINMWIMRYGPKRAKKQDHHQTVKELKSRYLETLPCDLLDLLDQCFKPMSFPKNKTKSKRSTSLRNCTEFNVQLTEYDSHYGPGSKTRVEKANAPEIIFDKMWAIERLWDKKMWRYVNEIYVYTHYNRSRDGTGWKGLLIEIAPFIVGLEDIGKTRGWKKLGKWLRTECNAARIKIPTRPKLPNSPSGKKETLKTKKKAKNDNNNNNRSKKEETTQVVNVP